MESIVHALRRSMELLSLACYALFSPIGLLQEPTCFDILDRGLALARNARYRRGGDAPWPVWHCTEGVEVGGKQSGNLQ